MKYIGQNKNNKNAYNEFYRLSSYQETKIKCIVKIIIV